MKLLPELRILDFDIECRPLSWYGGDYVTKEVTAIAYTWVPADHTRRLVVENRCLDEKGDIKGLLDFFLRAYEQADMVTGHFIRGFDLPVLNGALAEQGMPLLSDKLTHDTKLDLLKRSGLSNSQENLGAVLGLDAPKVQMNQALWRSANRLERDGIAATRDRVVGDVVQHVELRRKLIELGQLGPPRVWRSSPRASTKYHG